jgi:hypothetical protein
MSTKKIALIAGGAVLLIGIAIAIWYFGFRDDKTAKEAEAQFLKNASEDEQKLFKCTKKRVIDGYKAWFKDISQNPKLIENKSDIVWLLKMTPTYARKNFGSDAEQTGAVKEAISYHLPQGKTYSDAAVSEITDVDAIRTELGSVPSSAIEEHAEWFVDEGMGGEGTTFVEQYESGSNDTIEKARNKCRAELGMVERQ